MNIPRLFALCTLSAAALACGNTAPSNPSATPSEPELATVEPVSSALAAAELAVDGADSVDVPRQIANALASIENVDVGAIAATIDALEGTYRCASISADPNTWTVTVDFGSGCEVRGRTYAGAFTVHVEVDTDAERATFTIAFDELSVDGAIITGTATYVAEKPGLRTLTVSVELSSDNIEAMVTAEQIRVVDDTSAALDATMSIQGAIAGIPMEATSTATGIERTRGECAPHAGTVAVEYTLYVENPLYPAIGPEHIEETHAAEMTFDATSPITGTVEVTVDGAPQTVDIPSCQDTPTDLRQSVPTKRTELAAGRISS